MKVIKLLLMAILLGFYSQYTVAVEAVKRCQVGSDSCTFVLLSELKSNVNKGQKQIHIINEKRANKALSPYSTFKIANSLVALNLDIIKNTKQKLSYDKAAYPVQAWWPPVWQLPHYDLTTAFKYSMVAIYRQLAKDIGETNMQAHLKKMQYGNQDISSGLDNFWLNGSMKISALEQVHFLQKIYHNQFALKPQAISALKEVMLVENTSNYRLFAKTGAGKIADGGMLGWYVGFVENSTGVHFFAFNFDSPSYAQMKAERITIAKEHLKLAGIIE